MGYIAIILLLLSLVLHVNCVYHDWQGYEYAIRGDIVSAYDAFEEDYRQQVNMNLSILSSQGETSEGTIRFINTTHNLAILSVLKGDFERARELHEEALTFDPFKTLLPSLGFLLLSSSVMCCCYDADNLVFCNLYQLFFIPLLFGAYFSIW